MGLVLLDGYLNGQWQGGLSPATGLVQNITVSITSSREGSIMGSSSADLVSADLLRHTHTSLLTLRQLHELCEGGMPSHNE